MAMLTHDCDGCENFQSPCRATENGNCGVTGQDIADIDICPETSPQVELKALEKKDSSFFAWVESVQISSTDQQKNCEDLLIIGRRAVKTAEEKRKELLQPIKSAEKQINDLFKPYMARLETGITKLNSALNEWHAEQRKLAEAAQIEQMKRQTEAIQQARETGEVISLETTETQQVNKTSHAHVGTVTYRKKIKVTVVNADLVPRDLCDPSPRKLQARADSGVKDIPGCIITEETITVARAG